ncbi:hypothetical protein K0038_00866 [Pseudomonas syringae]|nr:hypothetical protein [Pseudomonas syringae]
MIFVRKRAVRPDRSAGAALFLLRLPDGIVKKDLWLIGQVARFFLKYLSPALPLINLKT